MCVEGMRCCMVLWSHLDSEVLWNLHLESIIHSSVQVFRVECIALQLYRTTTPTITACCMVWEETVAAREGSRWRLAWVWATELELMVTLLASGAVEEEGQREKSIWSRDRGQSFKSMKTCNYYEWRRVASHVN